MEGVQLKALELLSQINKNSSISVLSQTPHLRDASSLFLCVYGNSFLEKKTQNYCVVFTYVYIAKIIKNSRT